MNYIHEINAFHNWMAATRISSTQQTLWFHLMDINNRTGWKENFTVANLTLCDRLSISRQGLDKARQALVEYGRIEYKQGAGNQAGTYKIISFDGHIVGTPVVTVVGTNDADGNKVGTQVGTLVAHYLKENENITTTGENPYKLFQNEIGVISGMVSQMLQDDVETYGSEWVCDAIREAAKNNVRKYSYIESILKRWGISGRSSKSRNSDQKAMRMDDLPTLSQVVEKEEADIARSRQERAGML